MSGGDNSSENKIKVVPVEQPLIDYIANSSDLAQFGLTTTICSGFPEMTTKGEDFSDDYELAVKGGEHVYLRSVHKIYAVNPLNLGAFGEAKQIENMDEYFAAIVEALPVGCDFIGAEDSLAGFDSTSSYSRNMVVPHAVYKQRIGEIEFELTGTPKFDAGFGNQSLEEIALSRVAKVDLVRMAEFHFFPSADAAAGCKSTDGWAGYEIPYARESK